jgi:hypothetical protein
VGRTAIITGTAIAFLGRAHVERVSAELPGA